MPESVHDWNLDAEARRDSSSRRRRDHAGTAPHGRSRRSSSRRRSPEEGGMLKGLQRRRRILRVALSIGGAFAGAFLGVAVSTMVWPDQVPGIGFMAGAVAGFLFGRVVR